MLSSDGRSSCVVTVGESEVIVTPNVYPEAVKMAS
jgi:hypothetical protein